MCDSITVNGETIQPTSDDRLKFDEVFIRDGLDTINKLRPQTYNKWSTLDYEQNRNAISKYESGLIAQEIYVDAPELRHLVILPNDIDVSLVESTANRYVSSSDPRIDPKWPEWGSEEAARVNYIGLIPYTISAIQELSSKLDNANRVIAEMQDEIRLLKGV